MTRNLVRLTTAVLFLILLAACGSSGQSLQPTVVDLTSSVEQLEFGVEMAKRGLWSEALFRFKQAYRLDPGNPRTLNNLAVAYEALGQFEKALDHYQSAIKADPGNKDLKRNYSRFVEFYRNFKPDEQQGASSGTTS